MLGPLQLEPNHPASQGASAAGGAAPTSVASAAAGGGDSGLRGAGEGALRARLRVQSGLVDRDGVLGAQGLLSREPAEAGAGPGPNELTQDQLRQVQELKARDREVRAHEQAHASAGGQYAGSPRYSYQVGPDRRRYAVEGEVSIDVSPVSGDPAATVRKMDQVKKAALAPASPSAQDRAVAAKAEAAKTRARAELNQQKAEQGHDGPASAGDPGPPEAAVRYDAAAGFAPPRDGSRDAAQRILDLVA